MISIHQVLWWIPAVHIPTVDEGKEKLDDLRTNGASKTAFSFARVYRCEEARDFLQERQMLR